MFQFTREFIINNSKGKLKEVDGKYTIPAGEGKYAVNATQDTLYIDNLVNIEKKSIVAAYKNPGIPAQNEIIKVTIPALPGTPAASDVYRLVIALGQEGRVISTYNDQYPNHTNQIIVEATGVTTAADLGAALVTNANRADAMMGSALAKLENGNTTNIFNIEALDEFTRVRSIKLIRVNTGTQTATGYGDGELIINELPLNIISDDMDNAEFEQKGYVGQGTTNVLIRNHRLPITANFDPYGADLDERPVPGGVYTQYTLELVTERRQIGHQVVGALDRSLTTMVFYVLESSNCENDATADFEDAFGEDGLGITFEPAVDPAFVSVNSDGIVEINIDWADGEKAKAAPTVDAEAVSEQNALETEGTESNSEGGTEGSGTTTNP